MKMTVVSTEAGVICVDCEGGVTQSDLWEDANPLENLLGNDTFKSKVLVSMVKTLYLDSAGVGWFISCQKQFAEAGGTLILHSIPPMVNQIFQLLHMDKVLHLAKDEAAARAMLAGGRK